MTSKTVGHPTPWRIEHRNVPLADTGDYDDLTQIMSADGEEVAQWWNATDEEEEVAERIVRTMNSSETIRVALLERIARLATELCVSVDKAAEDIGGERPALEILRDIGPLTDQLEKLGPEPAAGLGVIDLAGSSSPETTCAACAKHEKEMTQELEARDRNADYADQLTSMIGVYFETDHGEHSNLNDPWENAIETMRVAIGTKPETRDLNAVIADLQATIRRMDEVTIAKSQKLKELGFDWYSQSPEKATAEPAVLDKTVTICDACKRACCWQGEFMCDGNKGAGIEYKTVRQLLALNAGEHSEYWFKDPATGEVNRHEYDAFKRAQSALKTNGDAP